MFFWFQVAMLVTLRWTPTWRLHTRLCKIDWHVSANNSEAMYQTDFRRGVIYVAVFYNISFYWFPILFFVAWQWKHCCWTTWRLHTKFYKLAWNFSTNNSETMERNELRFEKVIKRFVSYNIPSSWRFRIYFSLCDCVAVCTVWKTISFPEATFPWPADGKGNVAPGNKIVWKTKNRAGSIFAHLDSSIRA